MMFYSQLQIQTLDLGKPSAHPDISIYLLLLQQIKT